MFSDGFRTRIVQYGVFFIAALIGLRLVSLQVVEHGRYEKLSRTQAESRITVSRNRGRIIDVKGRDLAQNRKVASLYVYAPLVENKARFYAQLEANHLSMASSAKRLFEEGKFAWIERGMEIDRAARLKKLIDGVGYYIEEARLYPEGSLAANVVGFTGTDNKGLAGVEYYLNDTLAGDTMNVTALKDSKGRLILLEDNSGARTATDVQLSIDMDVQLAMEDVITRDTKRFGAKNGIALAVDVQTGDILGAASAVSFDPNEYAAYPQKNWKNFATSYLFEPGSIFKAVTFSYLVEKGLFDPTRQVDCENGRIRIYNHTINDVKKHGILNAVDVFVESSNVGTIKLTDGIDGIDFAGYLAKAGFGRKPSLLGAATEDGLLRSVDKWSGLSRPSISIGQEIMVTPLQMVLFYAAIANGGELTAPRLVTAYRRGGEVTQVETKRVRIMREETAHMMSELLRRVVTDGTGVNAASKSISVAGKTGTGQKFDSESNHYSSDDYVASFAGFFPFEAPEIALVVLYDSPSASIYGGSTAARSFQDIAERIAVGMKLKRITAGTGAHAAESGS